MSSDVEAFLQQAWREDQVPLVDGILFSSGELYEVNYYEMVSRGVAGVGACVREGGPSRVGITLDLVAVDSTDTRDDVGNDVRYSCGEGSFGSDGYIACTQLSTGDLRWVAFFQHSNPFTRLMVDDDFVTATNNHGHSWRFPKRSPISFSVD